VDDPKQARRQAALEWQGVPAEEIEEILMDLYANEEGEDMEEDVVKV
jgi:nitrogen fixation protein FixH